MTKSFQVKANSQQFHRRLLAAEVTNALSSIIPTKLASPAKPSLSRLQIVQRQNHYDLNANLNLFSRFFNLRAITVKLLAIAYILIF